MNIKEHKTGNSALDEIIEHLQIWEKFKKERIYIEADVIAATPKYNECTIEYLWDKFKQKYYSKEYINELEALDSLLKHCDFTPSVASVFNLIYQILKKRESKI